MNAESIVIVGVNWLGDCIMSMPALQAFRRLHPSKRLVLVTKRKMAALWRLHDVPDTLIVYEDRAADMLAAARQLRAEKVAQAIVFPNSTRAAIVPWLARVPVRAGFRGKWRRGLLTQVVPAGGPPGHGHQVWEYYRLLGLEAATEVTEGPRLLRLDADRESVKKRFGLDGVGCCVGLVPGAAYGPSKQWPPEYFVEVGRSLAARWGVRVAVLGTASEAALCARVTEAVGESAMNLGGRTSLGELAAVLSLCRVAVTNDSGGMHLAAAAGTRVVAVFGITDPETTGPLGEGHRVLTCPGVRHSRDLPRDSAEARAALKAIKPESVTEAALEAALARPASAAAHPTPGI